jgi:hypothetical protein
LNLSYQNVYVTITEANKDERDITTGIAIARTSPYMLYFGCQAQSVGTGGAGMVHLASNGHRRVWAIESNKTRILAGSMFLTNRCLPAKKVEKVVWEPQQTVGGATATFTMTSFTQFILAVQSVVIYLLVNLVW